MAESKYAKLIDQVTEALGGTGNITSIDHCMTRLRFLLKDGSKVDLERINHIDGVLKSLYASGQYQVVIGQHVEDVYNDFVSLKGLQKIAKGAGVEDEAEAGEKKSVLDIVMDYAQAIVFPVTFTMCACAIINGINIIARFTGLWATTSTIYKLFSAIGNAVIWAFPVFLGYTAAKKAGISEFLGMAFGAAMINPNASGVEMDLFGRTITTNYTSTMLPVVIIVLLAAPMYKYLFKKLPVSVRSFLAPCLTLAVFYPIGFLLIGPIVNTVGTWIGNGLNSIIDSVPVLAGFLAAGTYSVCVIFGLHSAITMPFLMNVLAGIPDSYSAMRSGVCFAMAAMSLAAYLKTKNAQTKNLAFPAFVSGMFGVTEPALYGIAVPNIKTFVASSIGAGLGGALAGLLGCKAWGIGSGGVFQVTGYINPADPQRSLVSILAVYAVSFIASFVLTWLVFKDPEEKDAKFNDLESVKKYNAKAAK